MKEKKVKTAIIAVLLATAIVSPSSAQNWFKVERPCGSKCPVVQPDASRPQALPTVGAVRFRQFKETPDYQSRTVITSDYGTSVYTYRSYSR